MYSALCALGAPLVMLLPGQPPLQYGQPQYPQQGGQAQPTYPYSSQPAAPQQGTGMQSGGLAPPPPLPADPESTATEQGLEQADRKDSGRGLEFVYLNAEIGFQHLGLQTFSSNDLVDADVVETTQTGLLVGAGLGLRLLFLTLGARFRLGTFSAWDLWTLGGEVGFHIPLGNLEPYFLLGGGYASLGAFGADDAGGVDSSNLDVSGYFIRAGGGLDYYVTPVFSVGANATVDLVGLSRSGTFPAGGAGIYEADGSSLGFGVTGTAVLGLHF